MQERHRDSGGHDWMSILNEEHIFEAIRPREWGPSCWHFIDCLVFSYPVVPSADQQKQMGEFFHALKHVLPCYSCRRDFTAMMEADPIERHLHSREALARWVNEKHNHVNTKLGKPEMPFDHYVSAFVQKRHHTQRPAEVHGASAMYHDGGDYHVHPGRTMHDRALMYGAQSAIDPKSKRTNWVLVLVIFGVTAFAASLYGYHRWWAVRRK